MEKLIILDFSNSSVFVYDVASGTDINEEYVENLGYNIDNISWMVGNMSIHFCNRVLE